MLWETIDRWIEEESDRLKSLPQEVNHEFGDRIFSILEC
ncbi:hypothetical protein NIES2098_29950 [Calothrix sp. NIES-2098]|nr:hypothetical protein NIES2098_29950 [Calothrix sp. NIES-2098]